MAHYLLLIEDAEQYRIVLADSAKDAVGDLDLDEGTVDVWTLRSNRPRIFEIVTESVRTVKLV